jgi:3-phenylpropionate/cinnamic acid dioxygenase small subunit
MSHEDVQAITALLHEYAYRLDAGDIDGVVAMFEHARLGAVGRDGWATYPDGVRAQYAPVALHSDGTPGTMHLITNVTVTVAPDRATASSRSYFTVLQAVGGAPYQPIVGGAYHDRFERVDGAWRFTERVFEPRLVGDLSRHLRHDFGLGAQVRA